MVAPVMLVKYDHVSTCLNLRLSPNNHLMAIYNAPGSTIIGDDVSLSKLKLSWTSIVVYFL